MATLQGVRRVAQGIAGPVVRSTVRAVAAHSRAAAGVGRRPDSAANEAERCFLPQVGDPSRGKCCVCRGASFMRRALTPVLPPARSGVPSCKQVQRRCETPSAAGPPHPPTVLLHVLRSILRRSSRIVAQHLTNENRRVRDTGPDAHQDLPMEGSVFLLVQQVPSCSTSHRVLPCRPPLDCNPRSTVQL